VVSPRRKIISGLSKISGTLIAVNVRYNRKAGTPARRVWEGGEPIFNVFKVTNILISHFFF
jgi:hypothetical protein